MKLKLTSGGKDILLQTLEGGDSPIFVSMALGNGADAGEKATALSNQLASFSISSIDRDEGSDFVQLTATLNNATIASHFRATELGVFCEDTNNAGETVLFAYAYVEPDKSILIPAITDYSFETTIQCFVYVGQVEDVSAAFGESAQYATKLQFIQHSTSMNNPHGVSATQLGLGNVQNYAPSDMPISFTEPTGNYSLEEIHTGGTLRSLFGSVAKVVKSVIAHLTNKNNPHAVTAQQAGAAPSSHSHSANDVKSGVLPVSRGGTGASTVDGFVTAFQSPMNKAVFGTYTGDGTVKRFIELGFTPKAVLLLAGGARFSAYDSDITGGLAIGPLGIAKNGYDSSVWNNDASSLLITTNGFYVNYKYEQAGRIASNANGIQMRYIAWM